jgi:hypothetical protein
VPNEDGVAVEKWRVLAPTSELLPVFDRYKLAARINGVLKGVATAESFTLSQSYYFGSVKHNPAHFAQVIDGEWFVDCCDDLDAGAIGAPVKVKGKAKASPQAGPETTPNHTEADLDEFVRTANDINTHGDRQWHNNIRSVTSSMVRKFKTDAEIYERCAPACREGFGDADVKKLIDTAREKYGVADPETSSNEFISLLSEFTAEAAAAGIKGPGFRSKDQEKWRPKLTDFYAFLPTHTYIFIATSDLWPAVSLNAIMGKVKIGTEKVKLKKKDKVDRDGPDEYRVEEVTMPASLWLDRHRPVQQMGWAPGYPQTIDNKLADEGGWVDHQGAKTFNTYKPPPARNPAGDARKAGPWVELLRDVYPDHADHIAAYLAHLIQYPGVKINHALVMVGAPGIGKDTLLEPLSHGLGEWNFKDIKPHNVAGPHNDYLKCLCIRINETHDLGDVSRFTFYENTKTMIAAPPAMVRINTKYVPQYYIPNVNGTIMTTNHGTDGLYLEADDRRHYVAGSEITSADYEDGYLPGIWQWYADGGLDHVVAYLAELDLAVLGFTPTMLPAKTPEFWRMVDAGGAAALPELRDAIDAAGADMEKPEKPPAAVTLAMVKEASAKHNFDGMWEWLHNKKNAREVLHRMEDCGYEPVRCVGPEDGLWVIKGRRVVIYGNKKLSPSARYAAAETLKTKENAR